jgi:hypothetical protein
MKKNVWTFGLLAGLVNVFWMISFMLFGMDNIGFDAGELLGFAAMILSFSLIAVAVYNYREKYNGGVITFGKAFQIGILISLIGSGMYIITWLIEYFYFIPDFGAKYAAHIIDSMRAEGKPEAEVQAMITKMDSFREMYNNPLINAGITFTEIFPVGLAVTLITAFIFKRSKPQQPIQETSLTSAN